MKGSEQRSAIYYIIIIILRNKIVQYCDFHHFGFFLFFDSEAGFVFRCFFLSKAFGKDEDAVCLM